MSEGKYHLSSIFLTFWKSASSPETVRDPDCHHYNKTVPQIVYRFAFELRMLPLTGTTDVAHMRDGLDIFDFTLTHDEIETLLALRGPALT